MWRFAPVVRARMMSRATATSSAAAGIGRRPAIVEANPSFMTPDPVRLRSSQWEMIGRPTIEAYSRARRMTVALSTGLPSSENATAPASASAAISVSVFPPRPTVIAAIG